LGWTPGEPGNALGLRRADVPSPACGLSNPRRLATAPLAETGIWEFTSERDPGQTCRVTFGRAGHLECTCKGFGFRGNCKHVREVGAKVLTAA
jgi:hypothetical protein